ncbi:hypothetical protein L798_01855 [Zootermopsis nevadensis]|uniref:Centrosomal protein of 162 kDa n=1 Tax=Zootermopsis nevadensis TaxID=136037 RepID=A0A067RM34_ZOONE|nr:hypothetical protein L798_01855 [Zootermopsis nevadensis]
MSYLDSQFEEFLKEPLSGESADTSSSTKHETNMEELSPAPRNFWWMKERPQAEKLRVETGVSSDSSQMERGQASVSATMKNIDVAKTHVTVSPNLSSSMAEFLEKEKLCNELRSSVSEADSPAVGFEFQGDDVTDDDIGSIMEQLSQLAGSADDSATDKSVEEILKEAEDLVRETSYSFSGLSDSSNLLDLPITRRLDRSTAVGLTPESKTSKKTDKRFITEEKGKKAQSSLNRASAVSASYRKMEVKSANLKMRDKGERLRGMSPRRTGSESGMEEFNGDNKFGDSRELAYSNTHDDIGARLSEIKVGSVISDSKSGKHLGNVSGSTRKERDSSKKDRTVTFEDGLHLFPKPTDTISKKHEDTVETSRKKLQQVESISNIKSGEISSENDALFALGSSAVQQSTRDASSATDDKRVDRVTKEVSVSAPLIQHGDMVTTPEAIFCLIDGEARNEVVPALQESEKNYSQDSDHSSLNIEKEMENIFGRDDSAGNTMVDLRGDVGTLFHKRDQSAVVEDSNVSEPALHVDKLKDASTMTSLEELLQEQSTSSQLKAKLESEEQGHKRQLDALKCKHEEEMFALKRDIYILNAKIADFEKQRESPLVQKGDGNRLIKDVAAKEHRIALLETELQQHEQLMLGYQRENIKLCQDMKKLKVCLAFVFLSPRLMA